MEEKQKDTKAAVDYFLNGCVRGCLTEKGKVFENLLFEVLVEIWPEVEERAEEKLGLILYADGASVFSYGWLHRYTPHATVPKICQAPGKWIIFFPESLVDYPARAKYVIAHELAHFMLGHDGGTNHKEHEKGEKAADDLAKKWGFPEPKLRGRQGKNEQE